MKYKVILIKNNAGSENDYQGSFTFYTLSQAQSCCEAWTEASDTGAWLWNGQSWTYYP